MALKREWADARLNSWKSYDSLSQWDSEGSFSRSLFSFSSAQRFEQQFTKLRSESLTSSTALQPLSRFATADHSLVTALFNPPQKQTDLSFVTADRISGTSLRSMVDAPSDAGDLVPGEEYGEYGAFATIPTDTLFGNQWYLRNTGAGFDLNLTEVWDDYTGAGIDITVIDEGFDFSHTDISPNYDTARDWDFGQNDGDASPFFSDDRHGTPVMGIIGAAQNGTGVVGVAFDSNLIGFRIDYSTGTTITDAIDATSNTAATNYQATDIVNMSFGLISGASQRGSRETDVGVGAASGRGGLGTIYVKSAGNSRGVQDTNLEALSNIFQTITVAAALQDGTVTGYSTHGASTTIAAFGSPGAGSGTIFTTDNVGTSGYNTSTTAFGGDFTASFNGTSAAAPEVSGVVALMLEANPDLGWRDVQTILAYSARHVGSAVGAAASGNEQASGAYGNSASWLWNDADNWNGGGLHFSNDYGYGLIDALAAVRLAETWTDQSTSANLLSERIDFTNTTLNVGTATAGSGFTIGGGGAIHNDGLIVEYVEVEINFTTWDDINDLQLVLTSPSGTVSRLADGFGGTGARSGTYTFASNLFRGESADGNWSVGIFDRDGNAAGQITVDDIVVTVFGEQPSDPYYVFTDEYSDYDGVAGHATSFNGTGSSSTFNLAAVTSASTVNALTNSATIDGVSVSFTNIGRIYTGDGDDTIVGDTVTRYLNGGRGDDNITGGTLSETIIGGRGADTIDGGNGDDIIIAGDSDDGDGADTVHGGEGDDQIYGGYYTDTVYGDAGNDTFFFLNDDFTDTVDGGTDIDAIDFTAYDSAYDWVVDLTTNLYGRTSADTSIVNVENIFAGDGDDTITGTSGANVINGGGGNDTIVGNDGGDTVNGEGGHDQITISGGGNTANGGTGNDTVTLTSWALGNLSQLDGGSNFDTLSFAGFGSSYVVNLTTNNFLSDADTVATIVNFEAVTAGAGNDTLTGSFVANTLNGGGGDDTIAGLQGSDTLIGGTGIDTLDYSASDAAVNVNLDSNTVSGGHAQGDTVSEFENVIGSAFSDTLVGSTSANVLRGGDDGDFLQGLGGVDSLYGESGDDYILAFSDFFDAGTLYDGGADTDTLSVREVNGVTSFNLRLATITDIEKLIYSQQFGILENVEIFASQLNFSTIEDDQNTATGVRFTIFMDTPTTLNLSTINFINFDGPLDSINVLGNGNSEVFILTEWVDDVDAGGGDDTVSGSLGADILRGGADFDTLDYSGSNAAVFVSFLTNTASGGYAEGDTIVDFEAVIGSDFDDTLYGLHLNDDRLEGGKGNDTLAGYGGTDTILGQGGNDKIDLDVNSATSGSTFHGGSGTDKLQVFGPSGVEDLRDDFLISLETLSFAAGADNDYTLMLNADQLIFDLITASTPFRGNESLKLQVFMGAVSNLDMSTKGFDNFRGSTDSVEYFLTAAATIIGSATTDIFHDAAGASVLSGGLGTDIFRDGDGRDTFNGDEGDDTFEFFMRDFAADIDGGADTDLVNFEQAAFVDIDLALNEFVLGGTTYNVVNVENIRGSAQDDVLLGDNNDNVIEGMSGEDELDGRGGNDTVSYRRSNEGVIVFLGRYAFGGHANGDTLTDFENIIGSDFNDLLVGDSGANKLSGGDGRDVLEGGAGGDMLDGGTGVDTAIYIDSDAAITINLDAGTASGGHAAGDTLLDIEHLTGSRLYGDTLTGNGEDNRLLGDGGDDILEGLAGADVIHGGKGTDNASYRNSTAGINIDLLNRTASGGHAEGDKLVSIEEIDGSDFGDIIQGTNSGNTLSGFDGDDELYGLDGKDTLNGGLGNDLLNGGDGNDKLYGGDNDDNLYGGDDNDRLYGGNDDDRLNGGAGIDRLYGQDGEDVLIGGDDNDKLYGGNDNDKLYGGEDKDRLSGGDGIDRLYGQNGNDVLIGGDGRDFLEGGDGADIFRYDSMTESGILAADQDIITDFVAGTDRVDLRSIGITDFVSSFTGAGDEVMVRAVNATDWIIEVDKDGDSVADMSILLENLTGTVTNSDFLLA